MRQHCLLLNNRFIKNARTNRTREGVITAAQDIVERNRLLENDKWNSSHTWYRGDAARRLFSIPTVRIRLSSSALGLYYRSSLHVRHYGHALDTVRWCPKPIAKEMMCWANALDIRNSYLNMPTHIVYSGTTVHYTIILHVHSYAYVTTFPPIHANTTPAPPLSYLSIPIKPRLFISVCDTL